MLAGDDYVGDAHGVSVLVFDADLALAVGTLPFWGCAVEARCIEGMGEHVGVEEGGGEVCRCFVGGIAEHDALVAGTLLTAVLALCGALVHALGDIRALCGDMGGDVEVGRDGLAEVAQGAADDGFVVEVGAGGYFSCQYHMVVFHQRFAGHAGGRVFGQAGVYDGVGDVVGYFVGVPCADGF